MFATPALARALLLALTTPLALDAAAAQAVQNQPPTRYAPVDSGQTLCYDAQAEITCPTAGSAFAGQDAQYRGNAPRYQDNGDGTVTDLITGLMWQQDPGAKQTFTQAQAGATALRLGGHSDWRLPAIKELYSLIQFNGTDPSNCMDSTAPCTAKPFLDTDYFDFAYGDTTAGERIIDAQYWSATPYVGTTMNGNATQFGVNFADGRIKGYPRDLSARGGVNSQFVRYVRGNPDYGTNQLEDKGNGTILDRATGLTWAQGDSGQGMDWQHALAWCEATSLAGQNDWRLPNAKELQSILDYSRSPSTSGSAAIDPLFNTTPIQAEDGVTDFPFYWTSTTHADNAGHGGYAVYIAFGEALGYMQVGADSWRLLDVHGAGAQRSDPKTGDPAAYPHGHGPQGDVVRIYNYVRCVRGATDGTLVTGGGNQTGTQPQPPAAAIAACSTRSAGAACSFTTPTGNRSGTCTQVQSQLACVPAGAPGASR